MFAQKEIIINIETISFEIFIRRNIVQHKTNRHKARMKSQYRVCNPNN